MGFAVGPERNSQLWSKALAQYFENARRWSCIGGGLHYATIAYNSFVISPLSFLWQLANLPPEALRIEDAALRMAAPGPGFWCVSADLSRLKEFHGMPRSFTSLSHAAHAAKLRVSMLVSCSWEQNFKQLNIHKAESSFAARASLWESWYSSAFVECIRAARTAADALKVDPVLVWGDFAKPVSREPAGCCQTVAKRFVSASA